MPISVAIPDRNVSYFTAIDFAIIETDKTTSNLCNSRGYLGLHSIFVISFLSIPLCSILIVASNHSQLQQIQNEIRKKHTRNNRKHSSCQTE